MQLSLSTTQFQQSFLQLTNNQSEPLFKAQLQNFNRTGQVDHSLTTTLFNLISQEIHIITDVIATITTLNTTLLSEMKTKRKLFLTESSQHCSFLLSSPLLVELKFTTDLRHTQHEFNFFLSKFKRSMDRIFLFSGVYEELYIISAYASSLPSSYTLSYSDSLFAITHGTSSYQFSIYPIFLITKFLLKDSVSDIKGNLIMEYLMDHIQSSSPYLLTISEEEHITLFKNLYTMKYLSSHALGKVTSSKSIRVPKLINFLHLTR